MSDINMEMLISNPAYDADWIEKVQKLMIPNSGCELRPELGGNVDLEKLSKLDCRKLHVLAQLLDNCEDEVIKTKTIHAIIHNEELNATQVQLIAMLAANIDNETDTKHRILATLINADIPYAKLNYVAKAVMEGFYYIMVYITEVDTSIDQIAAIYATFADKCYDALEMERFIRNDKLIISADKINLLRHLCVNKMEYIVDIDEDLNVKITVL